MATHLESIDVKTPLRFIPGQSNWRGYEIRLLAKLGKRLRKVLKEDGVTIESLSLSDRAQPVRLAHLQVGDKLVRLREAFDTLDPTRSGRISLPDLQMAFKILARRDLAHEDLRSTS